MFKQISLCAAAFSLSLISSVSLAGVPGKSGINVVDLTPRFLAFYEKAIEVDSADERFLLWKEHYDFVALPPGLPDRNERARKMLDEAWPNYTDVMDRIKLGISSLSPSPVPALEQAAELLNAEDDIPSITLLYYVGMLEDNAFFAPRPDGSVVVALPAEMDPGRRDTAMAHEFVHAIHNSLSDLVLGPEGSIANLVLSEGIAMHATRTLFPKKPDTEHLGGNQEWQQACHQRIDVILDQIEAVLEIRGPETVSRFTVGEGLTGIEREGYCAGWYLVDRLLEGGRTLAGLVRVPESQVAAVLAEGMALY